MSTPVLNGANQMDYMVHSGKQSLRPRVTDFCLLLDAARVGALNSFESRLATTSTNHHTAWSSTQTVYMPVVPAVVDLLGKERCSKRCGL